MPKVTKIEDHTGLHAKPLRVTIRKARRVGSGRTIAERRLVKCGCCDERLEINVFRGPDGNIELLEVGGVAGTQEQWSELFDSLRSIR